LSSTHKIRIDYCIKATNPITFLNVPAEEIGKNKMFFAYCEEYGVDHIIASKEYYKVSSKCRYGEEWLHDHYPNILLLLPRFLSSFVVNRLYSEGHKQLVHFKGYEDLQCTIELRLTTDRSIPYFNPIKSTQSNEIICAV
jgi:hypothetical protein